MAEEPAKDLLVGFWMAVYVAAIISGKLSGEAKKMADTAYSDGNTMLNNHQEES